MRGLHCREMSMVQCRQLWFLQPFDDRQDSSVDKSNPVVQIFRLQLSCPSVIDVLEIFNPEGTGNDIIKECEEVLSGQLGSAPIVKLDHHRSRHYPRLAGPLDHLPAALMVGIRAVDCCQERTGVYEERQASGSMGRSPISAARGPRPRLSPCPSEVGGGASAAAFSSRASRTMSPNERPARAAAWRSLSSRFSSAITVVRFIYALIMTYCPAIAVPPTLCEARSLEYVGEVRILGKWGPPSILSSGRRRPDARWPYPGLLTE